MAFGSACSRRTSDWRPEGAAVAVPHRSPHPGDRDRIDPLPDVTVSRRNSFR